MHTLFSSHHPIPIHQDKFTSSFTPMWPGRVVTDDCRVPSTAHCLCQYGIQCDLALLVRVRLMQIESSTMQPSSCGVHWNFCGGEAVKKKQATPTPLPAQLNCFCGGSSYTTVTVGFLRYEQVTWTGLIFEPSIHPFICSKG